MNYIKDAMLKLGWEHFNGGIWIKDGRKASFQYAVAYELERNMSTNVDIKCPTHDEPISNLIYFECGCFTTRSNLIIKFGSANEWLKYDG